MCNYQKFTPHSMGYNCYLWVSDLDLHCLLFDSLGYSDQEVNCVDVDQTAWTCQLILMYTVHTCDKTRLLYTHE
jgi:hypothetical protein